MIEIFKNIIKSTYNRNGQRIMKFDENGVEIAKIFTKVDFKKVVKTV